ncbi:MAG: penicillin-insensitive murein endopeptidase [Candidatus Micrarchaeota archaeon]
MEKKLLLVLLLGAIVVTSAAWVYKENEMQDNQVLVYLTGMDISGEVQLVEEAFPEIDASQTKTIKVDGGTADCTLTQFKADSLAIGRTSNGRLQNAALVPGDSPYIELKKTNTRGWGTTETINSLELAGCAVQKAIGKKLKITDISAQNGGSLMPTHKTHQNGLSVDLSLICIKPGKVYQLGGCGPNPGDFDVETSWLIIRTLAINTPVKRILLSSVLINKLQIYANTHESDASLRQKIFASLLYADPDHADHTHIDFHCSPKDTQCQESKSGYKTTVTEVSADELDTGETDENGAGTVSGAAKSDAELLQLANSRADKCLYFDPELNPIVRACSQRYGINENLIKAVAMHESGGVACEHNGGKPNAINPDSGAVGLMQLMVIAVQEVNNNRNAPGSEPKVTQPVWNPSQNICAGTQLLAIYWSKRNIFSHKIQTTSDLLQAYNGGPSNWGAANPSTENRDFPEWIRRRYQDITGIAMLPLTPEIPSAPAAPVVS